MANNYIFNTYKLILDRIGVSFNAEMVRDISRGYNLLDFNIFRLIGDMSVLNIANIVADKKTLFRTDLIFPVVGRKKDTNNFIVISDYHEKGFVVADPQDESIEISTIQEIVDSVDRWVVILEPSIIHEVEREERSVLYGRIRDWSKKIIVISIVFLLVYWISISPLVVSILMVVSLLGLVISYLLLLKKYGKGFEAVDKICDAFKQKSSCKKAVEFKFDNIFGDFVSLPALGIFFFCFSFLVFGVSSRVTLAGNSYWVLIIYLLALFSSVFLFSLQHFKLKTYCPLCIAVMLLIFILNSVVFSSWVFNNWYFDSLLFYSLISSSAAFFVHNKIKLETELALSQVVLRRDRWDTTVFRDLLQSAKELQFKNDNRLMVNFREGNTVLNVHISDSCDFCITYLKEILSLILLEDSYSLAIYLKSDALTEEGKLRWIERTLEYFFYEYSSFFNFKIGGVVGALEELIQKHSNGEFETGFLDDDNRVLQYPSSFLHNKQIPLMYEGRDVKRHLALLKYQ